MIVLLTKVYTSKPMVERNFLKIKIKKYI